MPAVSKCLVLFCLSAVLLASAGAFAAVDGLTAAFVRSLGTALGAGWDTSADPCTYNGITCGDAFGLFEGVQINLAGRGLSGTLPNANGATYITKIDLSNNNGITGTFPSSWASMIRVTDIDLSGTQLSGQIPDAWNGMIALENVKISGTKACYRLPSWSGTGMSKLKTVDLSNNHIYSLTASGFSALATSTTLTSVNIAGNPLCGCVNALWRTNNVLLEAAKAALPSSVENDCHTAGRDKCPKSNVCLSTNSTGDAVAAPLVPVAALAAIGALVALVV